MFYENKAKVKKKKKTENDRIILTKRKPQFFVDRLN